MQLRLSIKMLILVLSGMALTVAIRVPEVPAKKLSGFTQAAKKSPTGAYYSFNRSHESAGEFSLMLSDGDETVVTESFSVERLRIIRSVMTEARKFALSEEAVGTEGQPVTTRFSEKTERAFLVDISKLDKESQFFITFKSESGRLMVQAGTVNRGSKIEEGFFSDLLSRVEAALPRLAESATAK